MITQHPIQDWFRIVRPPFKGRRPVEFPDFGFYEKSNGHAAWTCSAGASPEGRFVPRLPSALSFGSLGLYANPLSVSLSTFFAFQNPDPHAPVSRQRGTN